MGPCIHTYIDTYIPLAGIAGIESALRHEFGAISHRVIRRVIQVVPQPLRAADMIMKAAIEE